MNEPKTFEELNLDDKVYCLTESGTDSSLVVMIKNDSDRSKILIELDDETEPISFPRSESFFELDGVKYSTNPHQYKIWQTPFVEKKIKEKQKRIEQINLEIQELRSSIQ